MVLPPLQDPETGIVRSKLITLGTCVNNSDPKRAGRIRVILPEGENIVHTKCDDPPTCIETWDKLAAKGEFGPDGGAAFKYIPWEYGNGDTIKADPFLFSPFLPLSLHSLPKKGEAVKVISWALENSLNQEWIGPLISNPGRIEKDAYLSGIENTAAGRQNEPGKSYASVGEGTNNINPISIPSCIGKGSFINPDDIGIYGRNNTDIILGMHERMTEDECTPTAEGTPVEWYQSDTSYPQVLIRAGKLISNNKSKALPTTNKKTTFIQINHFPQTLTQVEVEVDEPIDDGVPLGNLIEYKMDRLGLCSSPMVFNGECIVYKMPPKDGAGKATMCPAFGNSTPVGSGGGTGPTEPQVGLTMTFTNAPTIKDIGRQINAIISNIDKQEWSKVLKPPSVPWATKTFSSGVDLNNQNNLGAFLGNVHPFYFRPEASTLETIENSEPAVWPVPGTFDAVKAELIVLRDTIGLDGVKKKGGGLAYEGPDGDRELKQETKKVKKMVDGPPQPKQQGIITAGAEKIYLFSYDTTDLAGPIQLTGNYGISQKQFLEDIEPKTNSLVRGEKLLELLTKIASFQANHTHSCPGVASCPTAHDGTTTSDIDKLIKEAGQTILNKNIRIN
tara:strand:- start:926 stop:2776 length:1851 start_codon:yes stop_codon:yes gene_type:complete